MNKPQFDFSKQAKVPDEWIEKALAIPSVCPKQPARPVFPRRAVAAASIVLITVLSVSLFFFSGNKRQPEIAPAPKATEVAAPTADISSVWNDSEPTRFAAVAPEPTENSSASAAASASPQETSASSLSPTQPASQSSETRPAGTVAPTERPINAETRPAGTVAPTERPINAETQPQAEDPSEDKPNSPDNPSPNNEKTYVVTCCVPYDYQMPEDIPEPHYETESETMFFCRVYDAGGGLLGSTSLYAPSRQADMIIVDDYYELSYNFLPILPLETTASLSGNHADPQYFHYVFYDQNGIVVASGAVAV